MLSKSIRFLFHSLDDIVTAGALVYLDVNMQTGQCLQHVSILE